MRAKRQLGRLGTAIPRRESGKITKRKVCGDKLSLLSWKGGVGGDDACDLWRVKWVLMWCSWSLFLHPFLHGSFRHFPQCDSLSEILIRPDPKIEQRDGTVERRSVSIHNNRRNE
ncbi:hypothetical protein E2C01_005918 [Portunus trituberculatus]|uniref:Uncharacterized protein n=1 Tax=Portunus trituberculatus TaxID=210409 RepID=A0A5B7CXV7_PORTR|nr:hypothetical protein [Portunus trituberculatus]